MEHREIHDHKVNPVNDKLILTTFDEPGAGGAHHRYLVSGFKPWSQVDSVGDDAPEWLEVFFQKGPINEVGVNGVTQEVLLAIVLDRLRSFQKGPFASRENACAITNIEQGLHWLQQRTIERMRRGVEGTNQK